jgi:hypothetical protein
MQHHFSSRALLLEATVNYINLASSLSTNEAPLSSTDRPATRPTDHRPL